MKKRVKLLTTIASLCLAVALMAFGVYAAANVTFTTTSTVSFTATTDVFGTFEANVKKTGSADALDTIEATRANTAGSSWSNTTVTGAGEALGENLKLEAVNDEYVFTYKFTNTSPYAVKYTITTTVTADVPTATTADAETVLAIDTTDVTTKSGTIAIDSFEQWTISVKLLSLDIAADTDITVNFALALEK